MPENWARATVPSQTMASAVAMALRSASSLFRCRGTSTRILRDNAVPLVLCLKDHLYNFTDGSAAARCARDIVRCGFGFSDTVRNGNGKAHALHHSQIDNVVADVTHVRPIQVRLAQDGLDCLDFAMVALGKEINFKILGAF